MKRFAELYAALDETNRTNEKVAAMARYFREAPPADAAWAVSFLIGRRLRRLIQSGKLQNWAAEMAGIPMWLFSECYDAVGDLAETIALILPGEIERADAGVSLADWVTGRVLPLGTLDEAAQRDLLFASWGELDRRERFVFNKLITGAFRVGVSQDLVVRALSQASGVPGPVIAHRLMGDWQPTPEFYESLFAEETADADVSRPYPFCLAHPLEQEPASLGAREDWQIEWKWDGIRSQVIRRGGRSFVWSRGEELITDRFPEILEICEALPEGTVVDGEILAWADGKPLKFMALQRRIGRKLLTKKVLQEVPAVLIAFDLLELHGEDLRERPLGERRALLEELVDAVNRRVAPQGPLLTDPILATESSGEEPDAAEFAARLGFPDLGRGRTRRVDSHLLLSTVVRASEWEDLAEEREKARSLNTEGFMLKRLDSPYLVGRKRGAWWKWKIDPLTVDAVLIYAQRGSGKRASLYTDYTFGVWQDGKLVPFAKAYSGLNDEEIRQVDGFVRRNTLEKFGPVRTVKPELVFELAFEGIQLSTRHKSGVAVRFPRILRWRHDKKPEDADSVDGVKAMLNAMP